MLFRSWAEVLDADAFELFKERGLFDRDTARRFREHVLERGGTEHPMELYKRFRGREPDEKRWDIERPRLDSTAVRLSWNPTPEWALQTSWAHEHSPEQLEPDDNQTKWSASAIHTRYLDGVVGKIKELNAG